MWYQIGAKTRTLTDTSLPIPASEQLFNGQYISNIFHASWFLKYSCGRLNMSAVSLRCGIEIEL